MNWNVSIMGLDAHLYATLPVQGVDNAGNIVNSKLQRSFELWNLNHNAIREAEDKVAEYIRQVTEYTKTQPFERKYRSTDEYFYPENYEPVYEDFKEGDRHLEDLKDWLEMYENWNITWEFW